MCYVCTDYVLLSIKLGWSCDHLFPPAFPATHTAGHTTGAEVLLRFGSLWPVRPGRPVLTYLAGRLNASGKRYLGTCACPAWSQSRYHWRSEASRPAHPQRMAWHRISRISALPNSHHFLSSCNCNSCNKPHAIAVQPRLLPCTISSALNLSEILQGPCL